MMAELIARLRKHIALYRKNQKNENHSFLSIRDSFPNAAKI